MLIRLLQEIVSIRSPMIPQIFFRQRQCLIQRFDEQGVLFFSSAIMHLVLMRKTMGCIKSHHGMPRIANFDFQLNCKPHNLAFNLLMLMPNAAIRL